MTVQYDAKLAQSVGPTVVRALASNIRIEVAAKVARRSFPGVVETDFDPLDPQTAANPYPGYKKLLAADARVHYNRRRNIFLLSRYEDVRAAARADSVLSNTDGVARTRLDVPVLLNLDPPRHSELRRKVQPAFSRGALGSWKQIVDALAGELVDDLLSNPGSDVVQRLAVPMPMRMIAYILGIPPSDEAYFRHWSNETVRVTNIQLTPSGLRQLLPTLNGVRHLHSYFMTKLNSGGFMGENQVMGRLIANEEDGQITPDEMFYFALLLLLAGNETTTNLLSLMFLILSENPEQFEMIRRDPDGLLDSAVEELLRLSTPIQNFYRTAKSDYRVGDAVIPAGSRVALLWGAGNRDPRQFENPDAFIPSRNPSHLAFGSGIHLCLGAGLARMEGKAILRELIEKVDRIDILGRPTWTTNSSLRGLQEMSVALTPIRTVA